MAQMSVNEILLVIQTWVREYDDLSAQPHVGNVLIFENKGNVGPWPRARTITALTPVALCSPTPSCLSRSARHPHLPLRALSVTIITPVHHHHHASLTPL